MFFEGATPLMCLAVDIQMTPKLHKTRLLNTDLKREYNVSDSLSSFFSKSVQDVNPVERNQNRAALGRPIRTALLPVGHKLPDMFPAIAIRALFSMTNDLFIEL